MCQVNSFRNEIHGGGLFFQDVLCCILMGTMSASKDKSMSIEKLGRMVADGFSRMDEQFNGIGSELAAIRERLDTLEKRMGTVERGLEQVTDRLQVVETEVKAIRRDLTGDILRRIERLEASVK